MDTRYITDHQVNPANDTIQIAVSDAPGAGGANHRYELTWFNTKGNPSEIGLDGYSTSFAKQVILFQNGLIAEVGVNGITQEVLIAICIDRLRSFQAGLYSCRENAMALTKLEEAQMWLLSRTRARMSRNVEGTHTI